MPLAFFCALGVLKLRPRALLDCFYIYTSFQLNIRGKKPVDTESNTN